MSELSSLEVRAVGFPPDNNFKDVLVIPAVILAGLVVFPVENA